MNAEPEHIGEELIRLRAENRTLAADLFLAKKEAHDWKEWAEGLVQYCQHGRGLDQYLDKKPEPPK